MLRSKLDLETNFKLDSPRIFRIFYLPIIVLLFFDYMVFLLRYFKF